MKKVLVSLLLPMLVIGSCNKQEIENNASSNQNNSGNESTAGGEIPAPEVEDDEDDTFSNDDFPYLVSIAYNGSSATVSGHEALADKLDVQTDGARVTLTYSGTDRKSVV